MKTALSVLTILLLAGSSYAGNFPRWDAIPLATKEIIVKQYISGYLAGMNQGVSEGINSVIKYTKTTGDNIYIDSTTNIYTGCSNVVSSNIDMIYDASRGWQQIEPKDTKYYIDQMTIFLITYPICNKTDVTELVEILTPIWLNSEIKTSYEDVGRGCSR